MIVIVIVNTVFYFLLDLLKLLLLGFYGYRVQNIITIYGYCILASK